MRTVREITFDLLRKLELTTVVGNPGSTEEPFLADFPSDFDYVLALQETSAVAIADGLSQSLRRPVLVNLHTGAGNRQRHGRDRHRLPQQDASDRHGGTADPGDAADRAAAHQHRRDPDGPPMGQMELRTDRARKTSPPPSCAPMRRRCSRRRGRSTCRFPSTTGRSASRRSTSSAPSPSGKGPIPRASRSLQSVSTAAVTRFSSTVPTSPAARPGRPESRSRRSSARRSGPRPSRSARRFRKPIRCSRARSRRPSGLCPSNSPDTTSCWSWARRCSATTPTFRAHIFRQAPRSFISPTMRRSRRRRRSETAWSATPPWRWRS